MALRVRDLIDIMMQRAERLGLVDALTGKADAIELELYLFQALYSLLEVKDFAEYTVRNEAIASTQAGVDHYEVPDDFLRLIAKRVQNRRGIFLHDGTQDYELGYVDPIIFIRNVSKPQMVQRPTEFTVLRRQILLSPTPDTLPYRLHGVYIERVGRPDIDDAVLFPYPTVLMDETLWTLAGDMNRVTTELSDRRTQGLLKMGVAQERVGQGTAAQRRA